MERLVLSLALAAIAVAVAILVQRRRPDAPTQPGYTIPVQLDRDDFVSPDKPWLVVVFTSAVCETCSGAWANTEILASDAVAVQNIEVGADADLHARYRIDGVPTIVIADHEGVVHGSFLGPPTATDLWAAVAEAREPGSVPQECHDEST